MRIVGITVTPVEAGKINVAAYADLLSQGEPIIGKLVGIKTDVMGIGEVEVIAIVISYRAENPLALDPRVAQRLREIIEKAKAVKDLVGLREALVLECEPITAFNEAGNRVPLNFPLKPFLDVYEVSDLLQRLESRSGFPGRLWYLGHWHGTGIPHPVWLADPKALGEAYHAIIVGQTGSGKSTLAKMLLLGYACSSPEVNIFVLDPAGEFSCAFKDEDRGRFRLNLGQLWRKIGRKEPKVYSLENLAFDRWEIFEELLKEEEVFLHLNIKHSQNQEYAASYLTDTLKNRGIRLKSLSEAIEDNRLLKEVLLSDEFLNRVYTDPNRRQEVKAAINSDESFRTFREKVLNVSKLFKIDESGRTTLTRLAWSIMKSQGETVIIDLSAYSWADPIKYLLIKELLDQLYQASLKAYKEKYEAAANTLVIIDEVHRIAPSRELSENIGYQADCKRALIRAYIETRKFGLGWTVISTRFSTLDHNIYEHARVKIIGWGLGTGRDADILRELYGRRFLENYRRLPDPSDPFSERKHVFAIDGPICVFSRSEPEFVEVSSNPRKFLEKNRLKSEEEVRNAHHDFAPRLKEGQEQQYRLFY